MSVQVQLVGTGVQSDATAGRHVRDDRAHACQQFGRRERLDHIVDRAGIEGPQLVVQRATRSQEQHRRAQVRLALEHSAQRQAVLVGEIDVKYHQVECLNLQARACLGRGVGEIHLYPVHTQVVRDAGGDVGIVFDKQ